MLLSRMPSCRKKNPKTHTEFKEHSCLRNVCFWEVLSIQLDKWHFDLFFNLEKQHFLQEFKVALGKYLINRNVVRSVALKIFQGRTRLLVHQHSRGSAVSSAGLSSAGQRTKLQPQNSLWPNPYLNTKFLKNSRSELSKISNNRPPSIPGAICKNYMSKNNCF